MTTQKLLWLLENDIKKYGSRLVYFNADRTLFTIGYGSNNGHLYLTGDKMVDIDDSEEYQEFMESLK